MSTTVLFIKTSDLIIQSGCSSNSMLLTLSFFIHHVVLLPLFPLFSSSFLTLHSSIKLFVDHSFNILACHSKRVASYVLQSTVRKSLRASRRLSLIHQRLIQDSFFFFNSLGCYLSRSLDIHTDGGEKSALWLQVDRRFFHNDWHRKDVHYLHMCVGMNWEMSQLCVTGSRLGSTVIPKFAK